MRTIAHITACCLRNQPQADKLGLVDIQAFMSEARTRFDSRLESLLPSETTMPIALHQAMRYSALVGGKRFRPLLSLASALAITEEPPKCIWDAGCALEFVHCFSLIHDDLPALDNDDLRRGNPTCHAKFGEATAILAGDALFALSFETLSNMDASEQIRFACLQKLAVASGTAGMVGGQMVDLESEEKPTDKEIVTWIHERKTGALIAASCAIGVICAGGGKIQIAQAVECGQAIGLAFQIMDDILDETGEEAVIGKRVGADQNRQKATYPVAFGMDESRAIAREAANRAIELAHQFGASGMRLAELATFAVERRA